MVYFLGGLPRGEWRAPTPAVAYDPLSLAMIGLTVGSAAMTGAGTLISSKAQSKAGVQQTISAYQQYAADQRSVEAQRAAIDSGRAADEIAAKAYDATVAGTQAATDKTKAATKVTQEAYKRAAQAEIDAGFLSNAASEFKAGQFDRAAMAERSSAQREAMDVRRQKTYALSTLVARAAAGGGSVSDKTIQTLAGGLEKEGEFRALTKMFLGESAARGLEDTATGERFSGKAAMSGAAARAAGYGSAAEAEGLRSDAEIARVNAQLEALGYTTNAEFARNASNRALMSAGIGDPNAVLYRNLSQAQSTSAGASATLLSGVGSMMGTLSGIGKIKFG
jgi:hypothetical protein